MRSIIGYQLFGKPDLLIRAWLPSAMTADRFMQRLLDALLPTDVTSIEPFEAEAEIRHFAFEDEEQVPIDVGPVLDKYSDKDLHHVERYFHLGEWKHKDIADQCVQDGLVSDFRQYGPAVDQPSENKPGSKDNHGSKESPTPSVKFVIVIRGDERLKKTNQLEGLRRSLTEVLARAENIDQLSLYEGNVHEDNAFAHFLILGRVLGEKFHEIHRELLSRLNDQPMRLAYGIATNTSIGSQRGMLIAEEGLSSLPNGNPWVFAAPRLGHIIGRGKELDAPEVINEPDAPQVINEQFEIRRKLGSGGISDVFLVDDRHSGLDRALKLFSPDNPSAALREVEILQKLNHRGIARHIDHGEVQSGPHVGRRFIVIEFIQGTNLREVLESEPDLITTPTAVSIILRVLDALEYMHPNNPRIAELHGKDALTEAELLEFFTIRDWGTIHRDIKPENLMRTPDDQIKLVDFNIASPARSMTHTRSGTIGYLAPDAGVDGWAAPDDIFACGVVLYEMIAGGLPYQTDEGVDQWEPIDIRERAAEISDELAGVIMAAIAQSRADRTQSATEMRDQLLRCPESESLH